MADDKFDATKYKNDFQKEKYDRIIVNVPKGQKQIIDESAKKLGYKSLNSFVVDAINEKLKTNKWFLFYIIEPLYMALFFCFSKFLYKIYENNRIFLYKIAYLHLVQDDVS